MSKRVLLRGFIYAFIFAILAYTGIELIYAGGNNLSSNFIELFAGLITWKVIFILLYILLVAGIALFSVCNFRRAALKQLKLRVKKTRMFGKLIAIFSLVLILAGAVQLLINHFSLISLIQVIIFIVGVILVGFSINYEVKDLIVIIRGLNENKPKKAKVQRVKKAKVKKVKTVEVTQESEPVEQKKPIFKFGRK